MTAADIADLERRGLEAFSGLVKRPIGEWFVVVGPSSARRANSIYPIGDPGRALDLALGVAGDFLRSHGKPVLVKVAVAPGKTHDLEPLLLSGAFCPEAPTEVHTMPLARLDLRLSGRAFIEEALPVSGGSTARATASIQGGFARGRAVVMDDWIGIFDLETEPGVQRSGLGRTVLGSLLAWGAGQGVERAFLQVEATNVPARALYESAGFQLAYAYAYWREPSRSIVA